MQFRIDFLKPGRAFPKDNVLYRLKKRLAKTQTQLSDQLITRVGTSITTLVIGLSVLFSVIIFFYIAVYIPREKSIKNQAIEIKQLETKLRSMKERRKQEKAQWGEIKSRINQLLALKGKVVSWTDKLKAINRNLVKDIWLEQLEVKYKKAAVPKEDTKGKKRRRKKKKKKEKAKQAVAAPTRISVVIKGGTYAFVEDKPLKLVAEFMTNLMNDPVWEKEFDLADWVINTSVPDVEKVSEAEVNINKELAESLKTVSFRLELERK